MTSTDIVVFESGSTPPGHSLALVGSWAVNRRALNDVSGSDFQWRFPAPDSSGSLNDEQVIVTTQVEVDRIEGSCFDCEKNLDEVDVDCGGSTCGAC
eukprot:1730044-Rhodomonas_salina.1